MKKRILLHVCCAPDATIPLRALMDEGYEVGCFLYGNNIHPAAEWEKRRDAVKALSAAMSADVWIEPYEPDSWHRLTSGMGALPEGGERCYVCFRAQFEASAKFAASSGFECLCTTLSISPRKDPLLINEIGARAAKTVGLGWIEKIWRQGGGFERSVKKSREMGLYRQNYCGCVYSVRRRGEGGETI